MKYKKYCDLPEGKICIIDEDNNMHIINNSEDIEDKLEKLDYLWEENKGCYFCGFNLATEMHHIVERRFSGSDKENNLIRLCPNHHAAIHKGKYILGFKDNYIFLKNKETKEIINPLKFNDFHKREIPIEDINKIKKQRRINI